MGAWRSRGRAGVVAECAADAVVCLDTFHIINWATNALDEVHGCLPPLDRSNDRVAVHERDG